MKPVRKTPDEIKALREKFFLSQVNLAVLLGCAQQRIDEWERGVKHIGNAYSQLLSEKESVLESFLAQAKGDMAKYRRLVASLGVVVTESYIKKVTNG